MPSYRTVQVKETSSDFRKATEIVEVSQLPQATAGHVVVRNHYVGINAADINITNGVIGVPIPFSCGLEAVGVIVAVGDGVENVKVHDAITFQALGAFSEYTVVSAANVLKVPAPTPAMLPVVLCGVASSMALSIAGKMKSGETVLITSAAGSSGQFAVQLAKRAGNHVIGTCSSDAKVEVLKKLGVDRAINTSKEKIADVLQDEYPNGIDIVFETVGGETFKTAVEHIAKLGRIIVFGSISGYKEQESDSYAVSALNSVLLARSACVRGFIMPNHIDNYTKHLEQLVELITEGEILPGIDPTPFSGLEGIADALDRLYARESIGKLVVKLV